jgi:crossover junction endodeoxyribonuclease RuvC
MIILGVDPGFRIAGYCIAVKTNKGIQILDCGYLKMDPTKSLTDRVGIFYAFFLEKIIQYQVTHLSLETPFLGKNAQNFLKLGYLRGILYLLCSQHALVLHEFSPCQVKQSVTGFGGAKKDQVARVILQLFPRLAAPEKEDVTDAIAVTLCGLWHQPINITR